MTVVLNKLLQNKEPANMLSGTDLPSGYFHVVPVLEFWKPLKTVGALKADFDDPWALWKSLTTIGHAQSFAFLESHPVLLFLKPLKTIWLA